MSDTAQPGYLVLAPQAAWGTPVVPSGAWGLKTTSTSLSGQSDRLDDDDEIGGTRDPDTSSATMGLFKVAGSVEGLLRSKVMPLLFLAAGFQTSGAPTQDATTGAWTHTLTPSASMKAMTVEVGWGTRAYRRFADCLVDTLEITLDANGKATWSADLIGRAEAWQASPITPAFETDPVANYAGSAVTFDGLGTYRFESMSFNIANNLSDDESIIGSRQLDDVTPGAREITMGGTIKVGQNSPSVTDLYRAAVYGSKSATAPGGSDPYHSSAAMTFGSSRLIGTSVTKRYGHTFTVPDLVLNGFPLESSGSDRLTVDVEGKAYKGAGALCTITTQNAYATDYALAAV